MHFSVCIQYVWKIWILQVDNAFIEAGVKSNLFYLKLGAFIGSFMVCTLQNNVTFFPYSIAVYLWPVQVVQVQLSSSASSASSSLSLIALAIVSLFKHDRPAPQAQNIVHGIQRPVQRKFLLLHGISKSQSQWMSFRMQSGAMHTLSATVVG